MFAGHPEDFEQISRWATNNDDLLDVFGVALCLCIRKPEHRGSLCRLGIFFGLREEARMDGSATGIYESIFFPEAPPDDLEHDFGFDFQGEGLAVGAGKQAIEISELERDVALKRPGGRKELLELVEGLLFAVLAMNANE